MSRRLRFGVVMLAGALAACQVTKSENPLSPSVAGPIPGVEITQPALLEPSQGARIPTGSAVTLVVQNATTNGVRPLSYMFEVASDQAFANKVFARSGVTPGDGNRTTVSIGDQLASDRTYYWRAQALDGANSSSLAGPAAFSIYTPIVIQPPTPTSPIADALLTTLAPTLTVANAARSGPAGPLTYWFEVATDSGFGNRVAVLNRPEQSGQTSVTLADALSPGLRYYWRARAVEATVNGPWSVVASFRTPAATSPGPGGPTPGPAPGDAFNLNTTTVVKGVSIAGWAVTSQILSVSIVPGGDICTNHTMAGKWPVLPFFGDPNVTVEGNQWIFGNIGGQWYGGAGEWLRPGQTCKFIDDIGSGVFYDAPPLRDWRPVSGEMVGFAVSTPARAGQWGIAERSNVVVVRWP